MITLFAATQPPNPKFKPLQTIQFQSRIYLSWSIQPEPVDAGIPPELARALAQSWLSYTVVFLGGPPSKAPAKIWTPISNQTFAANLSGKISRICVSSDPEVMASLFTQTGFDWSQQAQFGLLFSSEDVVHAKPQDLADRIRTENIEGLSGLVGYLRPGDDGDFAELGFVSNQVLSAWVTALQAAASNEGLQLQQINSNSKPPSTL